MIYMVDLISVLKSLFEFTLTPRFSGTTNWEVLKEAFEAYTQTDPRQRNHDAIRLTCQQSEVILDRDGIRRKVIELLRQG